MAVTLSLLRTFVTVVRTGSVTRASEELVVTQSSVSGALAALSKEMGERLVERDGRGLRPTPAGAAFLPHAERVLATLEDAAAAVREAADPTRLRLRLAATPTAAEHLVPTLWKAFRQRHADVEVSLEVGNRAAVNRLLDQHQADIGIGGRPVEKRLRGLPFLENEFVLVTSPEDPRVRRGPLVIEELANTTWLVREPGSGTREVSTELFASAGFARPRLATIGSDAAIKRSAALGLGVALISRRAVDADLDDGSLALLNLVGGTPIRSWHALFAADAPRRTAAEAFLAFVRRGEAAHALEDRHPPPGDPPPPAAADATP
ncbi:MAG TPA: LysR family transcriptional regulator [Solirubrobacteraceae bacterium]